MHTRIIGIVMLILAMTGGVLRAQSKGKAFILQGNLSGLQTGGRAYISWTTSDGKGLLDSCDIKQGAFRFHHMMSENELCTRVALMVVNREQLEAAVPIPMSETNTALFYIVPGTTYIKGIVKLQDADITGTPIQKDWAKLEALRKPLFASWTASLEAYQRLVSNGEDSVKKDSAAYYLSMCDTMMRRIARVEERFLEQHPASLVSLQLLKDRAATAMDLYGPQAIEQWLNKLSPQLRASAEGKAIRDRVTLVRSLVVGYPALNFTVPDTLGNPVSLSSFKGKYVLVEFWASWCAPCRAQNPHLLKAYEKYRSDKLEFISVSIDDDRNKWMDAIHHDKLPWIQLSELKGFQSAVALQYNITAIPLNFLLDPDGIIIGKNLRDNALDEKLTKVFTSGNIN